MRLVLVYSAPCYPPIIPVFSVLLVSVRGKCNSVRDDEDQHAAAYSYYRLLACTELAACDAACYTYRRQTRSLHTYPAKLVGYTFFRCVFNSLDVEL